MNYYRSHNYLSKRNSECNRTSCDYYKDGRCSHPKMGDECTHHVIDCDYWESTQKIRCFVCREEVLRIDNKWVCSNKQCRKYKEVKG